MTTCSTFIALGMMPLLLYVYSRGIYDGDLKDKVPYGGIVLSLIMILIPCTIGIFLNAKRPQYVRYVTKVRAWGQGREQECCYPLRGWLEASHLGFFCVGFVPCFFVVWSVCFFKDLLLGHLRHGIATTPENTFKKLGGKRKTPHTL